MSGTTRRAAEVSETHDLNAVLCLCRMTVRTIASPVSAASCVEAIVIMRPCCILGEMLHALADAMIRTRLGRSGARFVSALREYKFERE